MPTPATLAALTILKDTTPFAALSCREFARAMWPDAPMHRRVSNQGNGATTGKAAWLCAGSYLARLRKKNLVSNLFSSGYYLTEEGKKLLQENSVAAKVLTLKGYTIQLTPNPDKATHHYNRLTEDVCRLMAEVTDQGERYSTSSRYIYHTQVCKSHNDIQFGSARAAVKRSIQEYFKSGYQYLIITKPNSKRIKNLTNL